MAKKSIPVIICDACGIVVGLAEESPECITMGVAVDAYWGGWGGKNLNVCWPCAEKPFREVLQDIRNLQEEGRT